MLIAFAEPVLVNVNVPVPNNSRPEAATFCDWVTVPVELNVVLPVVVKPAVFTVPIAKPEFSKNDTVPVLPAKVVIALAVSVKVKVPPVPSNSRPKAVIPAPLSCVTVPAVFKVRMFVVPLVPPSTETAPVNCMPPLLELPALISLSVSLNVYAAAVILPVPDALPIVIKLKPS